MVTISPNTLELLANFVFWRDVWLAAEGGDANQRAEALEQERLARAVAVSAVAADLSAEILEVLRKRQEKSSAEAVGEQMPLFEKPEAAG